MDEDLDRELGDNGLARMRRTAAEAGEVFSTAWSTSSDSPLFELLVGQNA
jgi:hypothetical protein